MDIVRDFEMLALEKSREDIISDKFKDACHVSKPKFKILSRKKPIKPKNIGMEFEKRYENDPHMTYVGAHITEEPYIVGRNGNRWFKLPIKK